MFGDHHQILRGSILRESVVSTVATHESQGRGRPGGVPPHWGAFVVLRDVPPGVAQVHVVQFVMGLPAPTVQRSRHRRRIQRRRWAATSDTAATAAATTTTTTTTTTTATNAAPATETVHCIAQRWRR